MSSNSGSGEGAGGPSQEQTDSVSGGSAGGVDEGFESYYDLLGVSADATTAEIERAYRKQAKQHHPDTSDRSEAVAEQRFRRLLAARDVLTSAERRRAYDELGHKEYRRQTESLGEPVRESSGTGGSDSEPRPDPGGESQPGLAQRSAHGEAHRRGDPLVTSTEDAFSPATDTGESTETPADDGTASGRGIYRLVFEDTLPASRSLQHVATRWGRSWRNRVVAGFAAVLLTAGAIVGLPAVFEVAGVGLPVSDGPGVLYAAGLLGVAGHTVYSCAASEARLPRGQFLADRDHGRFSAAAGRSYRRRGLAALALALGLAAAAGRNDARPWSHAADTLRGDLPGAFPWFGAPSAGWTAALDALLTGVFVLSTVLGALLLSLGVSLALWRGRYERGLRLRPSLWEPVLVLAPASTVFTFAAGPVALVSVDALSALPRVAARAAGVDGSTVTTATVATAGVVLLALSAVLSRLRTALAG
jgi:curved DNA-binding protein CbpA